MQSCLGELRLTSVTLNQALEKNPEIQLILYFMRFLLNYFFYAS